MHKAVEMKNCTETRKASEFQRKCRFCCVGFYSYILKNVIYCCSLRGKVYTKIFISSLHLHLSMGKWLFFCMYGLQSSAHFL